MAHEVGVQRQETIKRGCLAARTLIESGVTDWSHEAITAHLKTHEPKRSAAWFRGFLAYLLVVDLISDEDAKLVLSALNPGHWTSSGVSNAYFEFVQEFADSLGPISAHAPKPADHEDIEALFEFALDAEQPMPDENDPEWTMLAEWINDRFSVLSVDRGAMLESFVNSLLEPDQRVISGDWSEAVLRASQALSEMGWRVSITGSANQMEKSIVVDWNAQSIALPAPNAEAAHTLLRIAGRLCLPSHDLELCVPELQINLASELAGCVAGWALGVNMIGASLHDARSMMLSSDLNPKIVYESCVDATIACAANLLGLLGIEPSALSH